MQPYVVDCWRILHKSGISRLVNADVIILSSEGVTLEARRETPPALQDGRRDMSNVIRDGVARNRARQGSPTPTSSLQSARILSGRFRQELARRQRHCAALVQQVRTADRMLTGSLAACDSSTQAEMLAEMLEYVQELRVGLQRIESCLQESLPRGLSPG